MTGRYIGESIRRIANAIECCSQADLPGLLVSLDIQKAFDTLEWPFMASTLQKYGIGPNYIKWLEIMYANSYSTVLNNGYVTKDIKLERGARQGDPNSAYIFILCLEILSIAIRENDNIKGICINGTNQSKLVQFADDTTVFLREKQSLLHLHHILKEFGKISGLKINQSKTMVMGIGKWQTSSEKLY